MHYIYLPILKAQMLIQRPFVGQANSILVPTRQLKSSEVGKAQGFLWLVVSFMFIWTHSLKIVGWFVFPCSGMAQPASLGKPQNSRWTPEKNMIKYDKCVHILWKVSVFLGLKWLVSGNICGWLFKASSAPSWDSHWCCTLAIASSEWSNHWSRDDHLANQISD